MQSTLRPKVIRGDGKQTEVSGVHVSYQRGRSATASRPRLRAQGNVEASNAEVAELSEAIDRFERCLRRIHNLAASLAGELAIAKDEYAVLTGAADQAVRRARPRGLAELSPAESRIALRAASGATDAEIATSLRVSSNTVKSHMKSVLQKLGLHSRWELAHIAFPPSARAIVISEAEVHSERTGTAPSEKQTLSS